MNLNNEQIEALYLLAPLVVAVILAFGVLVIIKQEREEKARQESLIQDIDDTVEILPDPRAWDEPAAVRRAEERFVDAFMKAYEKELPR